MTTSADLAGLLRLFWTTSSTPRCRSAATRRRVSAASSASTPFTTTPTLRPSTSISPTRARSERSSAFSVCHPSRSCPRLPFPSSLPLAVAPGVEALSRVGSPVFARVSPPSCTMTTSPSALRVVERKCCVSRQSVSRVAGGGAGARALGRSPAPRKKRGRRARAGWARALSHRSGRLPSHLDLPHRTLSSFLNLFQPAMGLSISKLLSGLFGKKEMRASLPSFLYQPRRTSRSRWAERGRDNAHGSFLRSPSPPRKTHRPGLPLLSSVPRAPTQARLSGRPGRHAFSKA